MGFALSQHTTRKIIAIGFSFGFLFWMFDSYIDFTVFHEKESFLHQVFSPEPVEVWMRTLVGIMFLVFSAYMGLMLRERKALLNKLEAANVELEDRVRERTHELIEEIAERKKTVDALEEANRALTNEKRKSEAVIECIGDGLMIQDLDYRIMYENRVQKAALGEHSGEICYKAYGNRDDICEDCPMVVSMADGLTHTVERAVEREGGAMHLELTSSALKDHMGNIIGGVKVVRDITRRKEFEKAIQDSLKEKEALIKEIHHRVKNNMQFISSLLKLQSRYVDDQKALGLFSQSQGRIRSIALVHEHLYASENLSSVNMDDYIRSLVRRITATSEARSVNARVSAEVDDIVLGPDAAIPCGLIIHELLTNSLRHAFPGRRDGEVLVSFLNNGDQGYLLIVADNGMGLPESLDVSDSHSVGLELVYMLAKRQLRGEMRIDRGRGTCFEISFKEPHYPSRI